jgi:hypothetical protein
MRRVEVLHGTLKFAGDVMNSLQKRRMHFGLKRNLIRNYTGTQLLNILCLLFAAAIPVACDTADVTAPDPPTGGSEFAVDFQVFTDEIDPLLTSLGCDNTACHGGGFRGTFLLSPNTNKNINLDYDQVRLQINPADPADSRLLVKPLAEAAGGVKHAADSEHFGFVSTEDAGYQAILAWIEAGEYR